MATTNTSETLTDLTDETAAMLIELQVRAFYSAREGRTAKNESRRKDSWVAETEVSVTHRAMQTIIHRALFDLPGFGHLNSSQKRYGREVVEYIQDEAKTEYNRQIGEETTTFFGTFTLRI